MRKILIIFINICILSSIPSYAFWIWSPKTGKWRNPKYSPKPSAELQFTYAKKFFDKKDYKRAYKEFKKVVRYFPGSREAAESQYYMGRCLEEMGKDYLAFKAYSKVIESYPFSDRIEEIVKREFDIGVRLLEKYPRKILGMQLELVEHPSIEIFQHIEEHTPYSKYAPQAIYNLGLIYKKLSMFQEAEDAFQRLIENYPDSDWSNAARYQLALCKLESQPDVDYDQSGLQDAEKIFREFVEEHPEAKITQEAQDKLQELRNKEAEKNFKIAQFYEARRAYKSASIYYRYVISNFPETVFAKKAQKRLQEVEKLISKK